MNLKRMLTTVIGLPIVILVFFLGNKYVIGTAVLISSIICMHEYFKVVKKVSKPIEWVGYLCNIYIIIATFIENFDEFSKIMVLTLPIIMLLLFMNVLLTNMKISIKDVSYTLLGIMYIPLFMTFLVLTRLLNNGKILFGLIFLISWSTDIFAYLVGRNFGKMFFSKISPKKTIEGSIGGIIGAVIFSIIYTYISNRFWGTEYTYILMGAISAILSIMCQVGDFVASSIKRFVDVKDYGTLIPGHGGMLDRIDSLIFVTPFVYFLFTLII